jgi:transposase InsO family protein
MAVKRKRPFHGLINHSNKGSHECSAGYQKLLYLFNTKPYMSIKGNCYDNAPMESFWGTMKDELVCHRHCRAREQESEKEMNASRYSITVNGDRKGWGIYPLLSLNSNSMKRRRQHEYGLVSTIDIRGLHGGLMFDLVAWIKCPASLFSSAEHFYL